MRFASQQRAIWRFAALVAFVAAAAGSKPAEADPPAALPYSGVTTAQLQANWDPNGNGPGTSYVAFLSTGTSPHNNGFSDNQSSVTFSTSAVFYNLKLNTTYYVEVNAQGGAFTDLGSTSTWAAAPAAGQPTGVQSSQITAHWDASDNPAGTGYFCQISTDAGFATVTASTITTATAYTFSPLVSNTLYHMTVQAINWDGVRTDSTTLPSTATLVNTPGSAFSGLTPTQLEVTWGANNNPDGTEYQAVLSTAPFPGTNGIVSNSSATTTSLSTVFTDLNPNTLYYADVQALGINGQGSGYSSLGFTVTLANDPSPAATDGVSSNTLTAHWGENRNPSGTDYTVQISVDPTFAAILDFKVTTSTSAPFAGLTANTTYYLRVEAVNQMGVATEFIPLPSAATLPLPPGALSFSNVTAFQLQANWTDNGNPEGTIYQAILSTVPSPSTNGYAGNTTITTANKLYVFPGLQPDTTYYVDVNAQGSAYTSLGSTVTISRPLLLQLPFTNVTSVHLRANWDPNGNPAGTSYTAILSTGPSPSTNGFENSNAVTENAYTDFSSLTPNTLYYVDVAAGSSPSIALGSTTTLANAPTALPVSGVTESQITANWGKNDNPDGTSYLVQISSDSGFALLSGSQLTTNNSFPFTGLQPLTTYYLEVLAINADGVQTASTTLPTTETLALPPLAAAPPYTDISTGAFQANWTDPGEPPGTTYYAMLSTAPSPSTNGFEGNKSSATQNVNALFDSLDLNQVYYVDVKAIPPAGPSSRYTSLGITSTWANPPTGGSLDAVTGYTITASWDKNSNPDWTTYRLVASVDSGFASVDGFTVGTSTSLMVSGLQPLTTYYLHVQALDGVGVGTMFLDLTSTTTLQVPPPAPVLSTSTLGTTSITWDWTPGSVRADGYDFLSGAGVDLLGTPLSSSTLSHAEISLSTNSAYTREVSAFNSAGASTSTAVTVYTLAAQPLALVVSDIGSSSATLTWSANGNPDGTAYVARVWQAGGSTATVTVTTPTAIVSNLKPVQPYFFDVYAVNGDSVATAPSPVVPATTLFQTFVSGNIGPDGGTLTIMGPYGLITVVFPPGCFPYLVTVTLSIPSSYPGPASSAAALTGTDVGVQITVDPPIETARLVSITMAYQAINTAGLDPAQMLLARYDETGHVWVPLVSSSDPADRLTQGNTPHLSLFQMMGSPAPSSLSNALIYPNPFRPSQGHTLVNFSFLPVNARVRIYTLAGELVKDFSADATGIAHWDVTNRSGHEVASGVYFALVQSGGDKVVLKLAVQR